MRPVVDAYSKLSTSLKGTIIPLKCSAGSTCAPVLQEEKQYQTEVFIFRNRFHFPLPHCLQVTWGALTVSIKNTPRIQASFLTSTFGGYLPKDLVLVDLTALTRQSQGDGEALTDTACSEISSNIIQLLNQIQVSSSKPIGLLVKRGGCRFDQKAWNLQAMTDNGLTHPLGLMIIYDVNDEPLQRLGGLHPTDGYISIPAIMIPFHTAEMIQSTLSSHSDTSITATVSSSYALNGFSDWIEIALTEWEEEEENKLLQIEGLKLKFSNYKSKEMNEELVEKDDLMAWLERKRQGVAQKHQKKDEL